MENALFRRSLPIETKAKAKKKTTNGRKWCVTGNRREVGDAQWLGSHAAERECDIRNGEVPRSGKEAEGELLSLKRRDSAQQSEGAADATESHQMQNNSNPKRKQK